MTAVLDPPETDTGIDPDTLNEMFVRQARIDTAVRRKAAKKHDANDVAVLEIHQISGSKFDDNAGRVAGADHRLKTAGTNAERAAAVKRRDDAGKSHIKLQAKLSPKIADLEAELQAAKDELRAAESAEREAAAALAVMDQSRAMLRDRLLPESFREMLGVMARPVRQKFAPLLAAARAEVSAASGRIMTGTGGESDPGSLVAAETELKRLEAEQAAEILAIGAEIRDFYLCD